MAHPGQSLGALSAQVHAVFIAGGPNHGMAKHSPCHAHEVNVVVVLHV
jgi:hypothetical protein